MLAGNVPLCQPSACEPGVTISLLALWLGNDLPATVTLDGVTYAHVGGLTDPATATVQFDGSVLAPPLNARGVGQAKTAFTLGGEFVHDDGGVVTREPFSGEGIATVYLSEAPGAGVWRVDRILYQLKHSS